MSEKTEDPVVGVEGYSYDSFGRQNKAARQSHFLWWCAGAHQQLLRKFPSEQTRYAGLGGVVLATFVLAALSSGYAFYSVFNNAGWAVVFAIIWGIIIFNFDRFLISTMRKYGVSRNKQLLMALPRVALALLIGFTIARPLELKLFEKEIVVKMEENAHKKFQQNDSLLNNEYTLQLQTATEERERMVSRSRAIEDTLHQLQADYIREADGTGGSGLKGIEKLTRLKMEAYNAALRQTAPELESLKQSIGRQDSLLADARSAKERQRRSYSSVLQANQGFLEKNKALADLADQETSVWWSLLAISLLIILIETGPVLSKLIMTIGPYDLALAREELIQMAAEEQVMQKDKELNFEQRKNFYRSQKEVSENLVVKLTDLQKKHIDEELDKWERGEWSPKDHRSSMDEVLRKIRERYKVSDQDIL